MTSERLVLVVEEEPSLQLTLCASLMMMGLTARRAASVDAALGILGSARVDAVILSAQTRDALTLLMFLRATAEYAHVPVLMFTVAPLSDYASAIALRNRADVFKTPDEYRGLVDRLGVIFDLTPAAPLR
jgi:DNA-binding response OmpR family regulator